VLVAVPSVAEECMYDPFTESSEAKEETSGTIVIRTGTVRNIRVSIRSASIPRTTGSVSKIA
jgi:hypothetical protein